MKSESFIGKLQPDPEGLDFESLRQEGLRLVQEMSGDIWSDYNLHDPGVTMLEQLCYGLTDTAYRCGFPAADYLASSDGNIDYPRLALYRPDDILSSAPLTDADYRKLILNSLPNLDNVWIERLGGKYGGLYRINVLLGEQVKNQRNHGVCKVYAEKAGEIYAANRNLCEDLQSVRIVVRRPYALHGNIEIDGKRDPASVLAEIYAECARYLCPSVTVDAYDELYKSGHGMEELFTGVATRHGYVADDGLHDWRGHFSIAELLGRVGRIDGVDNVNRLSFVDAAGNETQAIEIDVTQRFQVAACLDFPAQDDAIGINLHKAGRKFHISHADVVKEFGQLNYKQQTLRRRKARFDWVHSTLPTGRLRELHEYYSVQNHFPDTYGINANGVPDSAGPERKAQALQLKAYMLLGEQILANFLQTVQKIPALFSIDETLERTYFHQVLGNDSVPGVEQLYQDSVAQTDADMATMLAGMDDYRDRRNRILDYLLALYGEKFSQNSLRHFFAHDVEPEEHVIRNKLDFLKQIVELTRDRASAFNYRKPANRENDPSFKHKLALLLGLDVKRNDFHIVEHILLRPREAEQRSRLPDSFYSFRLSIVLPAVLAGNDSVKDNGFYKLAAETVYMNCPAHIDPRLLWLDELQMKHFDALHKKWISALRKGQNDHAAAAAELSAFLNEHGERAYG